MACKLVYGAHTESLIEIALTYANLAVKYPVLTDTDSITWKQKFVEWANEFDEKYPDPEHWEDSDYLDCIDAFAREKIGEYGGILQYSVYFSFGSDRQFPYKDTYLVVYGNDYKDCVEKFRKHYPDRMPNILNCAFAYAKSAWEAMAAKKENAWCRKSPAEVIR